MILDCTLDEAVDRIIRGKVGVLPTDTVYGLVASLRIRSAVDRLYEVKPRELKPGTVIAASIDQFHEVGFPLDTLKKISKYWPGPVSVVIDASNVAEAVKRSRVDLPLRIPNDKQLLALLQRTGPLMTTSANAPGEPTSTTIQMAKEYFGDSIDFYVDGGNMSDRLPSTIIGFDPDGSILVHRQGAGVVSNTD